MDLCPDPRPTLGHEGRAMSHETLIIAKLIDWPLFAHVSTHCFSLKALRWVSRLLPTIFPQNRNLEINKKTQKTQRTLRNNAHRQMREKREMKAPSISEHDIFHSSIDILPIHGITQTWPVEDSSSGCPRRYFATSLKEWSLHDFWSTSQRRGAGDFNNPRFRLTPGVSIPDRWGLRVA